MADKRYLDYAGTELLWKRIVQLLNKKTVTNADDSIQVTNNNKVAVKISASEDNLLKLKPGEGLYVQPKLHTLTFGAHEAFTYDGSKDITVPVYDGNYDIT